MSSSASTSRAPSLANWRTRSWEAPESLDRIGGRALVVGIVGLAVSAVGFFVNREQFFQGYLLGYLFWIQIALGCLGFYLLHQLSRGGWGLVVRRIWEASNRTLPWLALLFLPIFLGLKTLYPWARPEAQADEMIRQKAGWLNPGMFGARTVLYFLIWIVLAFALSKLSRQQDETADPNLPRRMQVWAGPGILLFVMALSFASFDWMMSLDPKWASTIYGIYFLGGAGLSSLCFLTLIAHRLSQESPMSDVLAPRHFHDYGKLMFAFTMLWAYFSFSQFLIIWSANLPEEIGFYLSRSRQGWQYLSAFLFIFHFAVPFLLLLSRKRKRDSSALVKVAGWLLFMRAVDLYWQMGPMQHPDRVLPSIFDVAATVGIGGIWIKLFTVELRKSRLLPVNAPNLEEALGDE